MTYTIRSRAMTYFTGTGAEGLQVIVGWLSNSIVVLSFDRTGALTGFTEHPLEMDTKRGYGPAVEAEVFDRMDKLIIELGVHENPIHVEAFFIKHLDVGVRRYPRDLEEYLRHPERVSESDGNIFRDCLAASCHPSVESR